MQGTWVIMGTRWTHPSLRKFTVLKNKTEIREIETWIQIKIEHQRNTIHHADNI